jgi:hypothetical protein
MALTLVDIFNQSSSRSDFISKTGNDPNAGKMYDNFKKMSGKSGSGSGGSSFTGSGLGTTTQTTKDSSLLEKTLNVVGNGVKTVFGLADGVIKLAGKATAMTLESQLGKDGGDNTALDIVKAIGDKGVASFIQAPGAMLDAVLGQLKEESVLLSEINTKTGISGKLSEGLRDSMISASAEGKQFGFTLSQIGDFYTTLSEQSGKFSLINANTIKEAQPVAAALNMSLSELATSLGDYEKVGLGAKETTKAIGDAAVRSISLGLNARKVADGMKESVGKLNEYGFKNGVAGLERMVQKSVEFKLSMDSVATIADKVLNPEGAVDLAANLQVLGGAIGDFGDPIKMMYDATNNMEGLQDSLIGAAKGLATYNKEQGRFEITGINLRRGKEMASALGMTMEQLGKTAVAAQERVAASTALMSTGLKIDDKEKEFLTNLSRMQDGEMKIVVPESLQDKLGKQSEITLSKLTEDQKKVLLANKDAFEKMNPEKMAMAQLTTTQETLRQTEVIASWAKIQAASFMKGMGKEVLPKELEIIKKDIARVAGNLTPDRKGAESAGSDAMKAIQKASILDFQSIKNALNVTSNSLGKTFNTNQQPSVQQASTQTIQQNINITSDVNSDYFNQVIKKDAAFGFEFRNTKGYDVLTPAKRKGK